MQGRAVLNWLPPTSSALLITLVVLDAFLTVLYARIGTASSASASRGTLFQMNQALILIDSAGLPNRGAGAAAARGAGTKGARDREGPVIAGKTSLAPIT